MIFGVLNPEKISHQYLVHLPTSPVYCSHFTLGNPKSHGKEARIMQGAFIFHIA